MSVPLVLLRLLSLSFLNTLLKWEGSLYLYVNCLVRLLLTGKRQADKGNVPKKKKKKCALGLDQ